MKLIEPLLYKLIRSYLVDYLTSQKQCSNDTIKSYRTTLNMYLTFVAKRMNISLSDITFEMLNQEMTSSFISHLHNERKNGATTCNHRLICLRSFFKYVSDMEPTFTIFLNDIKKVPLIKTEQRNIEYMSETAVHAMLSTPDITTKKGIRDQFLMIMLYDTGARIQELLSIKIKDIYLSKTPIVSVTGKGRKQRSIPIMPETVTQLERYMNIFHFDSQSDDFLFYIPRKGRKQMMSDDNVRKILNKYRMEARKTCLEIPENIHPHLWRHSRAMHLYQHGMDLTLIAQWLGHAHLETTLIYAHADTEHKRKAIQKAMSDDSPLAINDGNERYQVSDETMLKRLYGLI